MKQATICVKATVRNDLVHDAQSSADFLSSVIERFTCSRTRNVVGDARISASILAGQVRYYY